MNVLILTHSYDRGWQGVAEAVQQRGHRPVPFLTDRFPYDHQLSLLPDGVVQAGVDGHDAQITGADATWYRRLDTATGLPADLPEPGRRHAAESARELFDDVLAALPGFVLNPPHRVRVATSKAHQYTLAAAVGLRLPRTLITNDPVAAVAFLDALDGPAVVKMSTAFSFAADRGRLTGMPTTLVDASVRAGLNALALSPLQFQERVPVACELRVTVVGSRLFCARLDTGAVLGDQLDWRVRGASTVGRWTDHALPDDVAAALLRLLDLSGLQYGAADFIVTPAGDHLFLECNPAGEFAWLEQEAPHFPISAAIADVLTDAPGARRPMGLDR